MCKHKDQLYPKEFRDDDLIIKNLEILLNYFLEKKITPLRFDLFSGEIWDTSLGKRVFDSILNAIDNGLHLQAIVIPSNCSFLLSDKETAAIETYMAAFKERKVRLVFSCSNDGLYLDMKNRPLNEPSTFQYEKGTQAYYERVFEFCKKWNLGFHPMVAADGIEEWGQNYIWWEEMLHKYDMDEHPIMYLEVRNDNWTDDKIIEYLKYLNVSVNYLHEVVYGSSIKALADHLNRKYKRHTQHYSPLFLTRDPVDPGCTVHRSLVVRLGDLAIVPCHRTSYDEFVGGNFKVENGKIVGVTARNIQIMNQVWLNNMMGNAKCGKCVYAPYCMKGCYGSQYETNKELLYPCETVCNLYKAKDIFLYEKYKHIGVLDSLTESGYFKKMIEKVRDTEEFKKWSTIA